MEFLQILPLFSGATTVRKQVIGYENRRASEKEYAITQKIVSEAMEEGAMGIGSSLIYAPGDYADTEELIHLNKVASSYGAVRIGLDEVYDTEMDIYAPCALGGTLNSDTLDRLNCDIVAGAANNQLKEENIHGEILREKEIIYAPDFAINAGGVINCFSEVEGLSSEWALDKAQDIYDTIYRIVKRSQDENIASHLIAMKMAQEKIDETHISL